MTIYINAINQNTNDLDNNKKALLAKVETLVCVK